MKPIDDDDDSDLAEETLDIVFCVNGNLSKNGESAKLSLSIPTLDKLKSLTWNVKVFACMDFFVTNFGMINFLF